MGLLRPARPQGAPPLRRDRPGVVAGDLQRRAGVDRGRRPDLPPTHGLDLPRHPPPVDVRRGGQRRPVPRGAAPARRLRPRLLLPPVARAGPRARPRRDGDPHPAGPGLLRRALRLPVPAGALRPGLRAQPRRRDGELGLRHLRRRPAVPHSPDPRAARGPRGVHLPRDGAHVVRRPRDDAVVGRPLAQRGLRVVGRQLGHGRRERVHRAVGHVPRRLQAHGLRDGHEPGPAPDPQRRPGRVGGDVELRRHHLRQGPERPAPARRLHRRGRLRGGPARLLRPLRLLQHPPRRPDGLLLPRLGPRPVRLDQGVARRGRHRRHLAGRRRARGRDHRRPGAAPAPPRHRRLRHLRRRARRRSAARRTRSRASAPRRAARGRPAPGQRRRPHLRGGEARPDVARADARARPRAHRSPRPGAGGGHRRAAPAARRRRPARRVRAP